MRRKKKVVGIRKVESSHFNSDALIVIKVHDVCWGFYFRSETHAFYGF